MDKVKPFLLDKIINHQNSDAWKIQLEIAIHFIFSKDGEEERVMHSKSKNIEFMLYDNANKVVDELFKWLLPKHQNNLETSMKGSDLVFDSVQPF